MPRYPCIVALFLLASCSPRPERTAHSFRIYEEQGVTIGETNGGPKYTGEIFEYEKLGQLNQDPEREESLLYYPTIVMADESGSFYVADIRERRIAVYGPDLNYSHGIGKAGQGPGEFQYPLMLWVHGGRLASAARFPGPTCIFSTNGDLLQILTNPRLSMNDHIIPTFEDRYLIKSLDYDFRPEEYIDYWQHRFVCLSMEGDTLGVVDSGWVVYNRYKSRAGSDNLIETPLYFAPYPQMVHSPHHGIYVTTGEEAEVRRYTDEGNLDRIFRMDWEPQPVTAADKDSALAGLRRRIRETEDPNRKLRYQQTLDNAWFPPKKAFWNETKVDESGFIWLRPPVGQFLQLPADHRLVWLVLSPDGEYLGKTRWPPSYPTAYLSRGLLMGYEEDEETGARHVVIYRIRPVVEGLKYP